VARVFAVWDSTLAATGQTLAAFRTRQRVPGYTLTSLGARGEAAIGQLDDRIRQQLAEADALLAFIDHPNANMAWELGLGLGLGKAVQMVREGSQALDWVRDTPLASMLHAERSASLSALRKILPTWAQWLRFQAPPEGGERTLLLCPNTDDGEVIREDIDLDLPAVFEPPLDLTAWRLGELPDQLRGVGRAAWIIPVGAHDQARHGVETTLYGLIAGYLEASNVPLGVYRCVDARVLADLGGRSHTYRNPEHLMELLKVWATKTPTIGAPTRKPSPDHTLNLWRDLVRTSHARRIPLLRDTDDIALDTVYVRLTLAAGRPFAGRAAAGVSLGVPAADGSREAAIAQLGADHTRSLDSAADRLDPAHREPAPLEVHIRRHLSAAPRPPTAGRWIVSGEPGAGKTTLARHLVCRLADDDAVVPIFLRLADLPLDANPYEHIDAAFPSQRLSAKTGALRRALDDSQNTWGRVWLVLDGLDEVNKDDLPARLRRLKEWSQDPTQAGVVFIVLAREQAAQQLAALGAGYAPLTVEPLTPDQQQTLVTNLAAAEVIDPASADRVRDTLDRGHLPSELVRNPLLLSLVALTAHKRADGAAPRVHRLSVLQDAVDLLLTRRYAVRDAPTAACGVRDPKLVRRLLRHVALAWHTAGGERWEEPAVANLLTAALNALPELDRHTAARLWPRDADDLLDELDRHGGVIGRFDGPRSGWGWLHRSFRELLAAEEVAGWTPEARMEWLAYRATPSPETAKLNPWNPTRRVAEDARYGPWSEVLGLLVGLTPAEAVPLLEGLVSASPAAAVRALVAAEGLDPWTHLDLLSRCMTTASLPAWTNDHLDRVVEALRRRDDSVATLTARLRPDAPTTELGLLAYVLERLGARPDRATFFAAAGRPINRVPALATISLHDPARRTFRMGSQIGFAFDDEHPQHTVTLTHPFSLGTTPVTVAQYRAFDPAHPCPGGDTHPVTRVDWFSARLFSWWVGGRLPTEAEWECACRAGTTTAFSFGDDQAFLGEYAWFNRNSGERTQPVGTRRPNPWGFFDLHGNVLEWVDCRRRRHYADDVTDPVSPTSGPGRVVRGGSAWNVASRCRSSYRSWDLPKFIGGGVGFRVAFP
jgi:hypothetical protein